MTPADFRLESSSPISAPLLPLPGDRQYLFSNRSLAVSIAAKAVTRPFGQEVRVVHVPTGEILFRKQSTQAALADD